MAGAEDETTLRVVSWNIEHGERIDTAIDALRSHPDLLGADLLLLQEMDDVGPGRIASALDLNVTYRAGCKHEDTGKPFGNAILARGIVGESIATNLPHIARFMGTRRVAVQAPVTIFPRDGGAPLEIAAWSVHAEISTLPHRYQVAQYGAVADQVIATASPRSIIGGDFNTASKRSISGLVDHMERANTQRASAGERTFFRFGRPFELDHLFSAGFDVSSCGVARGHGASDHDPIWSVLTPQRGI